MKSKYWINFNFNPWGAHLNDCAVRGIVAATGLDYREVCRRLGVSYKKGRGLIRDTGINLGKVEEVFDQYFDVVEDFYDNQNFVPDDMVGSKEDAELQAFDLKNGIVPATGVTLNEFIEMFKDQGTFIVSTTGNPKSPDKACQSGGHIICVKCNPGKKQGFIDTWDSGDMLVDAYMRVSKPEPANSPFHWKYDREKHKFIV